MRLDKLIDGFGVDVVRGGLEVDILDMSDDSRTVVGGGLFIARAGVEANGMRYVGDVLERGAVAILCGAGEDLSVIPVGVTVLCVDRVDQGLAGRLAERFWGYPGRRLKLVGVTGTNGKTTTSVLIQHLLNSVGIPTGLIGTVYIDVGGGVSGRRMAQMTTPGAVEITRDLARMVSSGCEMAVLELSSHALDQGRASALEFDVAVFTNLTGDHLDYHETMDHYAESKAILFDQLGQTGWSVVNLQDPYSKRMVMHRHDHIMGTAAYISGCQIGTCNSLSVDKAVHVCTAQVMSMGTSGSEVCFDGPWGSYEVHLPLIGSHNVSNALEALAASVASTGLDGVAFRDHLSSSPPVPGRLELVRPPDMGSDTVNDYPTVLVDYAHTHDALLNVLGALRVLSGGADELGRLVVLFGCGGDRDRTKRSKMGRVACEAADRIYITSDNPRTEDPQRIITDILEGVPPDRRDLVEVEVDRATAVRRCILEAGAGDIVLLAGKGHEDYQVIGRQKVHLDDRELARAALEGYQV